MKRRRIPTRPSLSLESEQLCSLASGASESSSRIEDMGWDTQLASSVERCLLAGEETVLERALETLLAKDAASYDALAEAIEVAATQRLQNTRGRSRYALLVAAPLLIWSRYQIPTVCLEDKQRLASIRAALAASVFGSEVQLYLADQLVSASQLPQRYVEAFQWTTDLVRQAVGAGSTSALTLGPLAENQSFLSDVLYVVGVAALPKGGLLFPWQLDANRGQKKVEALAQWKAEGAQLLAPLLTGCTFELLQPNAFYPALRHSDAASRAFSLRASVSFLASILQWETAEMQVVIALFQEEEAEEYRISFIRAENEPVLYGLVWPLLGNESEEQSVVQEIEGLLRCCGINDINALPGVFPLEYCEDCDSPLFVNNLGDLMHAEWPDDSEPLASRLH